MTVKPEFGQTGGKYENKNTKLIWKWLYATEVVVNLTSENHTKKRC